MEPKAKVVDPCDWIYKSVTISGWQSSSISKDVEPNAASPSPLTPEWTTNNRMQYFTKVIFHLWMFTVPQLCRYISRPRQSLRLLSTII